MDDARRFALVAVALNPTITPEDGEVFPPFKHVAIPIEEIINKDFRMDASFFGVEGRQARKVLEKSKYRIKNLCGDDGLAIAYHRPRFKRIYVEKSDYGIYQPSQLTQVYPKPSAYISKLTNTNIDALRVKKGQVLLTCSGTIGNCTYVRDTLDGFIFSHDVIRIEPKKYSGYVYAYLKSKVGNLIINTNNYGAVVSHIEPKHLNHTPIPDPPDSIKEEIHNLIEESFRYRDESNQLIDQSQTLISEALEFPELNQLQKQSKKFDENTDLLNYSVSLTDLNNRLDGSYHVPLVDTIEKHLQTHAHKTTTIYDSRICRSVVLPGRFKRVYVEEGKGRVFIGGKQIFDLDPSNKKYLSLRHHRKIIERDLTLRTNMTLISCSGTIGKVNIVPRHWDGWTANQHIIRLEPASEEIAGYLYAWLASDYAYPLIIRFCYGAVIDEVDDKQISQITVPLLRDTNIQRLINDKVLEANRKRATAYQLEQKALNNLNSKVILAS